VEIALETGSLTTERRTTPFMMQFPERVGLTSAERQSLLR